MRFRPGCTFLPSVVLGQLSDPGSGVVGRDDHPGKVDAELHLESITRPQYLPGWCAD